MNGLGIERGRNFGCCLLARKQPHHFPDKVKSYLSYDDIHTLLAYHFRNSTLEFRAGYTRGTEKDSQASYDVSLTLTARDKPSLADDIEEIRQQFPEFEAYQWYPDPFHSPEEAIRLIL